MIEFAAQNNEIELKDYDPDTTLEALSEELDRFRLRSGLKSSGCKGCGGCCSDNIPVLGPDIDSLLKGFGMSLEQASRDLFIMPEKPDIPARRKAIREMSVSASITQLEATLLFEYNNAEPIILAKQASGECCLLDDRLCSRYAIRPYSCGLYLCDMGERLSYIQEMIIRQGTWYAYAKLGWIDKAEISHNPFLKTDSYDKLLVSDFEFKLDNTLEQLFFYF
ncbi:MAG TPA: YkgJ family cysteine cluster protein [Clostridia bacterium]|nr:YkgJ family cysteine cluster protein [Clostridia bacterium]